MAYDSQSSDDEMGESFVTTDVLLGYASKEPCDDEISQLGGTPSWLYDTAPRAIQTACGVCFERMPLLLQLHADLPDRFAAHERRLHVFGCRRKPCRRKLGSVRVLRSTRVDPSQPVTTTTTTTTTTAKATTGNGNEATGKTSSAGADVQQPKQQQQRSFLGSSIFGGAKPPAAMAPGGSPFASAGSPFTSAGSAGTTASSPFSLSSPSELAAKAPQQPADTGASGAGSSTLGGLSATFAEKAKISASSPAPQGSSNGLPIKNTAAAKAKGAEREPGPQQAAYPSFFLDADYEALGAGPPAPEQNARVINEVVGDEGGAAGASSSAAAAAEADGFESAHDRTFQRFADRLWHNPEQVLRYEFGGTPLLYSRTDDVGKKLAAAAGAQGESGAGGAGGKIGTAKAKKGQAVGGSMLTGIPNCTNCNATRVFECQVTPHAIVELEADEDTLDGMEWGTIIVGVCSRDCEEPGVNRGKVGYVEEWAGVQWEENKR